MASVTALSSPEALAIHQRWHRAVFTPEPLDRSAAARAISTLYQVALGAPSPAVIFFASPRQAMLALPQRPQPGRSKRPTASAYISRALFGAGGVRLAVGDQLRDSLTAPIAAALEAFDLANAGPALREEAFACLGPQVINGRDIEAASRPRDLDPETAFDLADAIGWLSQREFLGATYPDTETYRRQHDFAAALTAVCRNVGWCWLFRDLAVVSERPEFVAEAMHARPLTHDGEGLRFRDGFSIRVSRGSPVPLWIYETPHLVRPKHVERERNVEIRRILLEQMGVERYLHESGAVVASEDEIGKLWRREYELRSGRGIGRVPLQFVEVINGTREADGSYRRYFLRVPPWIETARQGVAWTYGLEADAYREDIRT